MKRRNLLRAFFALPASLYVSQSDPRWNRTSEAVHSWHRVVDGLPAIDRQPEKGWCESREVLVCDNGGSVSVARWRTRIDLTGWPWLIGWFRSSDGELIAPQLNSSGRLVYAVTHWAEMTSRVSPSQLCSQDHGSCIRLIEQFAPLPFRRSFQSTTCMVPEKHGQDYCCLPTPEIGRVR